jgi:hypothetical protein
MEDMTVATTTQEQAADGIRADVDAAQELYGKATDALEAWAERHGGTGANALFNAQQDAKVILLDQTRMAVARTVGHYLVSTGKEETWRALFLLLLARFDFWSGWDVGYGLGDELAFLEDAGGWARDQAAEQATEEAKAAEGVPA